jgi:hypothetical protein
VLIATSPTNSHSDAGLAPATLFQYEVTAFDAASNESARSTPASATTHYIATAVNFIGNSQYNVMRPARLHGSEVAGSKLLALPQRPRVAA